MVWVSLMKNWPPEANQELRCTHKTNTSFEAVPFKTQNSGCTSTWNMICRTAAVVASVRGKRSAKHSLTGPGFVAPVMLGRELR
jgi:hypothetical protein